METGKFSLFLYVLVYFTLSQISFKPGNICKATTCRVYMTLFFTDTSISWYSTETVQLLTNKAMF